MEATPSSKRYLSCAETAKLVRKALKAEFPGQKFSVRSSTYAGGASIDVYWTDGPPLSLVDAVTQLYRGASFDGMIDLKSYHDSILMGDDGPEVVHFGADFIFSHREVSNEWAQLIGRKFSRLAGIECDMSKRTWDRSTQTGHGADGDGWAMDLPLAVLQDGQLVRMVDRETENAGTLLHRYTQTRWRVTAKT